MAGMLWLIIIGNSSLINLFGRFAHHEGFPYPITPLVNLVGRSKQTPGLVLKSPPAPITTPAEVKPPSVRFGNISEYHRWWFKYFFLLYISEQI
jgi:hypothetical protein